MEVVTPDITTEFAPGVPEEVPAEVPAEVPETLAGPLEPPAERPLEAELPPADPTANPPRVRKVRIKEAPPPKENHVYWGDRLLEHRATQRLAKDERYGNLRIM